MNEEPNSGYMREGKLIDGGESRRKATNDEGFITYYGYMRFLLTFVCR